MSYKYADIFRIILRITNLMIKLTQTDEKFGFIQGYEVFSLG